MRQQHMVFVILALVSLTWAQFDYGANVASVTPNQAMGVWNETSDDSFQILCRGQFGTETYSPAYTIDVSTRNLLYIHAFSTDQVTSTPFNYNSANNTFTCGNPTTVCKQDWRTNNTFSIFYDPALALTIMVDTVYENLVGGDHTWYNMYRIWKFSTSDCQLVYVDAFKSSPIDEDEETSTVYDYSNHRLYVWYEAEEVWFKRKLRAIDVELSRVAYDIVLPLSYQDVVFGSFDPASGYLLMFAGSPDIGNSSYQAYLYNPIHLNSHAPEGWITNRNEVGPDTRSMVINWRLGVFTSQHFSYENQAMMQISWNVTTGEKYSSFVFTHYVDYGWFYDPLLTINPLNINQATEEQFETLPGITSDLASTIVNERDRFGPFAFVESIFDRLPHQVTFLIYKQFRPYVCI